MNALFGFIVGVLGGLVANFLSPAFSDWVLTTFSRIMFSIDRDRFDLSGVWEHSFDEPIPDAPEKVRAIKERVELRQLGVTVTGVGRTDVDPRDFVYTMRVSQSMVYGSYRKRAPKGNITGAGMVQLIVDPGTQIMMGQATWFDSDTKQIESSRVAWKRL